MGGREGDCPPPRERLERRRGQRPSLGWIGAAANLVEQHERACACASEDLAQHSDVRRKRRQAGRDRLAIADVGEDFAEDGQRRMRADRRDNPALGH